MNMTNILINSPQKLNNKKPKTPNLLLKLLILLITTNIIVNTTL